VTSYKLSAPTTIASAQSTSAQPQAAAERGGDRRRRAGKGMDWHAWLSGAPLEPALAYEYALVFARNELETGDVAFHRSRGRRRSLVRRRLGRV